jgi:uncharacterized protein
MKKSNSLKIDAISHISPLNWMEALRKASPRNYQRVTRTPPLFDLDARFKIMDEFEGLVQVLTLGPVIEEIPDPKLTVELARIANDGMAELVAKYPSRFVAALACLPMNDIDAALKEVDRAIKHLNFKGVLINSNEYGKPLSTAGFMPLYEKMSHYDLPIFIHPQRPTNVPDYESKYGISSIFGWPYDTSIAMTHVIFSGALEKYPTLKLITHHGGGMIPYFEQRIIQHTAKLELMGRGDFLKELTKPPIEYYKMFYNDTAIHGNVPALMCAYNFCGADHILFGADMPLGDSYFGNRSYRQTINAIEQMEIPDRDKQKIFKENVRELMHLSI